MVPRSGRSLAVAALVAVALAGAAGCGGDDDPRSGDVVAPPAAAPVVDGAATDLRARLDRLLGEHALMVAFAMHKRVAAEPDRAVIAQVVLANSADLGDALEAAAGPAAAGVRPLWDERVAELGLFATAVAERDPAGRGAARVALAANARDIAGELGAAVPALDAPAFAAGLRAQSAALTAAVAERASAPERAHGRARAAYLAAFRTGDALATAIAGDHPDRYPAEGVTPAAADLRLDLDRLLGEHALLTAFAMQAGVRGAADLAPLVAALEASTRDLGAVVGAIYGTPRGEDFAAVWTSHIVLLVDYTVATAGEDTLNQRRALAGLEGYRREFADLLGRLGAGIDGAPIALSLQTHIDQLTAALTSFARGDHQIAYGQTREAYRHMFATGDALAAAIVADRPERFVNG